MGLTYTMVSFASNISIRHSLLTASSTKRKGLATSVVHIFPPIPYETKLLIEKNPKDDALDSKEMYYRNMCDV